MIKFTVYGDRFVCNDNEGRLLFELYPADIDAELDNEKSLDNLITALVELSNDEVTETREIIFEEA